jgi:hypothetical protein
VPTTHSALQYNTVIGTATIAMVFCLLQQCASYLQFIFCSVILHAMYIAVGFLLRMCMCRAAVVLTSFGQNIILFVCLVATCTAAAGA